MSQAGQIVPERATGPALVRASGIGVRRRGKWLIRGVDLAVHPGEIVTIIGPNGSGKTTTAKAILGIEPPDEGEVALKPRLRVGYVPQRLAIDRTLPLSVRRFMTLTAGHPAQAIDTALARSGIAHLADSPVQALSGGEFQRALLAHALIQRPDLLVLDEPVQNVDFTGEIELYDLIRAIRDELHCGVLLISHDLHIVMAETDTVICLNHHVCCSGTPHTVANDPAYTELFGAKAAETIAIYRHDHDHTHGPDGAVLPLEAGRGGHAPHDKSDDV